MGAAREHVASVIIWALIAFQCQQIGGLCQTQLVHVFPSEQACNAAMVAADPAKMPEEWNSSHPKIATCVKVVTG